MRARTWVLLLGSLALLLAASSARIWWMGGGKYLFQPRKWGVVEADGFYRSGQIDARIVEDVLREHEIDLIVDLASDDPRDDPHEAAERRAAARLRPGVLAARAARSRTNEIVTGWRAGRHRRSVG